MKKLSLLVFLLLHFVAFSQSQKSKSNKNLADLEPTFNQILKDWHIAGFAVAVVEKDRIIYSKGFGYRDVEKKLPVDANTLFAIGSCTKAFTNVLLGQLADEGKLDIDKPVTSFYPKLRFYNDNMNNMITIRDMMSHRTGVPRHDISWYLFPSASRDSLVKRIQFMEPSATVREKWQYNNFMYMALGAIDEQFSSKSWDDNIKQKIFAPLNMKRSTTNLKDWKADPNSSLGYGLKKDSTLKKLEYFDISGMSPAGAINSSANEMGNWAITWINNGKFNGKEIIPVSFRTEAISSQMIEAKGLPSKENPDLHFMNYGFGWWMSSYKGHYLVEHGGAIDGFVSRIAFFPTDSIGIIVLSNQDDGRIPTDIIKKTIADKVLGLKFSDWNSNAKKAIAKAKASQKDEKEKETTSKIEKPATHHLKDYVGNYYNPGYGTIKIYLENNKLYFDGPSKKILLKHKSYDSFDLIEVDANSEEEPFDVVGQFNLNSNGDIDNFSAILQEGVKPIELKKIK